MPESDLHRRKLRLGTRGSQLARWQAKWVAERLQQLGHSVELVEISTRGDVERARSIEEIGTRGVFTKEIQRALLAGVVDLGVHSLKDLPTDPVDGLIIAAVPPRESAADVLVMRPETRGQRRSSGEQAVDDHNTDRNTKVSVSAPCSLLSPAARIGTGSLRRQAQLRHVRPDLRLADIRGNIDTRLHKLDRGEFDAIVLAEAGLRRLGLADRIQHVLPVDMMLPAVGQGALAIECRAEDISMRRSVTPLNDYATHAAVLAERALLSHLRGGCMAPVGAFAQVLDNRLHLSAVVLSSDGAQRLSAQDSAADLEPNSAETLGRLVAESLLQQGAARLIAAARGS